MCDGHQVRESSSNPGSFVVSVLDPKGTGKVTHVVINNRGGKLDVGGGGDTFESLAELVAHYRTVPMVEKSGNVISLSKPLNATKIRAAGTYNNCTLICLPDRVCAAEHTSTPTGHASWCERPLSACIYFAIVFFEKLTRFLSLWVPC